ncbi:MAG: TlpA family protein disulfide reductase [Gammaproteobacteria bacterium]|nr:TlpA family protein disulfide reductase [Gammaproteobacteria bacterium]
MKLLKSSLYILLILVINIPVYADYPPAPKFQLPTEDGVLNSAQLKGKLVYIDFWASWCRPCKNSFPWMIAMKEKFKNQDFEIVAINLDKDKTLADEFIASQNINFPIAFDPQAAVAEQYNIEGMPSSYLIDQHGNLRIRYTGFWNKSKNEKELTINKLLKNH